MEYITSHLLLIGGAIGCLAYFTGFIMRLIAGENAYDGTIYAWRSLLFGGTGLLGACAALAKILWLDEYLYPWAMAFFQPFFIACGAIGGLFFLIAFIYALANSGKTVFKWSYNTMRYVALGGVMGAGAIMLIVFIINRG